MIHPNFDSQTQRINQFSDINATAHATSGHAHGRQATEYLSSSLEDVYRELHEYNQRIAEEDASSTLPRDVSSLGPQEYESSNRPQPDVRVTLEAKAELSPSRSSGQSAQDLLAHGAIHHQAKPMINTGQISLAAAPISAQAEIVELRRKRSLSDSDIDNQKRPGKHGSEREYPPGDIPSDDSPPSDVKRGEIVSMFNFLQDVDLEFATDEEAHADSDRVRENI